MTQEHQAHTAIVTVAGHYLSMQPADAALPLEKVWYRGSDYAAVLLKRDQYLRALEALLAIFYDPNETGDSETLLKILDIVEKALKK